MGKFAGFLKRVKNFFKKVGDGIGKGIKFVGQIGQKIANKIPSKGLVGKAIKYVADKASDIAVRTGDHLSDISRNGSSKEKWKQFGNDLKDIAPGSVVALPFRLIDAAKKGGQGIVNELKTQLNEGKNLLTGNTNNSPYDNRPKPVLAATKVANLVKNTLPN